MRPLRAGRALLSGNEGTRRETVPRTNTFTEARNKLISLARILSKGHFCDSLAVILLNLNINHEGMWFLGHTEVFQVFLDFFGARRSFFRERRATRVPWRDLTRAALGL